MKTGLATIALAVGLASAAHAQTARPVWTPMHELVFSDSPTSKWPSTGTLSERTIALRIWAGDLASRPDSTFPAFVLIGEANIGGQRVVFTLFDAAGSTRCEPVANGAGAYDFYTVCTMRVTTWPPAGRTAELPGYCMLYAAPKNQNRVEYAVDPARKTIAFRTIQYGQVVPRCSRELKLG